MSRRKKQKHQGGPKRPGPANAPAATAPGQSQSPSTQTRTSQAPSSSSENKVIQAENPLTAKGQIPIQSVMVPRRNIYKKQMHQRNAAPPSKRYGLVFYETLQAARNDLKNIEELAKQFDQLNIVIRAEVTTETNDIAQFGKVFTGAAWTLIHERRKQDGWYDAPHE